MSRRKRYSTEATEPQGTLQEGAYTRQDIAEEDEDILRLMEIAEQEDAAQDAPKEALVSEAQGQGMPEETGKAMDTGNKDAGAPNMPETAQENPQDGRQIDSGLKELQPKYLHKEAEIGLLIESEGSKEMPDADGTAAVPQGMPWQGFPQDRDEPTQKSADAASTDFFDEFGSSAESWGSGPFAGIPQSGPAQPAGTGKAEAPGSKGLSDEARNAARRTSGAFLLPVLAGLCAIIAGLIAAGFVALVQTAGEVFGIPATVLLCGIILGIAGALLTAKGCREEDKKKQEAGRSAAACGGACVAVSLLVFTLMQAWAAWGGCLPFAMLLAACIAATCISVLAALGEIKKKKKEN